MAVDVGCAEDVWALKVSPTAKLVALAMASGFATPAAIVRATGLGRSSVFRALGELRGQSHSETPSPTVGLSEPSQSHSGTPDSPMVGLPVPQWDSIADGTTLALKISSRSRDISRKKDFNPTLSNLVPEGNEKRGERESEREGGAQSPPSGRETWLTPYGLAWQARTAGGLPPYGQLARYLRPLISRHGGEAVARAWCRYLAEVEVEWLSPARFASTFGHWAGTAAPSPREMRREPIAPEEIPISRLSELAAGKPLAASAWETCS